MVAMKRMAASAMVVIMAFVMFSHSTAAEESVATDNAGAQKTVETFIGQLQSYNAERSPEKRAAIMKDIVHYKLRTKEDMKELRKAFQRKFEEKEYTTMTDALKYVADAPELAGELEAMLTDEEGSIKEWDAAVKMVGDEPKLKEPKNEEWIHEHGARNYRARFLIAKLGTSKSPAAVPVLRRMLKYKVLQNDASEALAALGDTSANAEIKTLAEEGAVVNYGGMGIEAVKDLVGDLQNPAKKANWHKLSRQLGNINTPEAKPYIKQLFTHENSHIRGDAARKFSFMVDSSDIDTILAMAKSNDKHLKTSAIWAMQRLTDTDFSDILISMLNDNDWIVRSTAAHALGYKKVQKAVPYLKKLLEDKDMNVRHNAFMSLYFLTDIKYDYKGKDKREDIMAEQQKKSPSFY